MRTNYDHALFITDVKVAYHDGPELQIQRVEDIPYFYTKDFDGCTVAVDPKITSELVKAIPFRTHDGKEVYVGASKEVQDILRIPFEAFDNMNRTSYQITQENRRLHYENDVLKRDVAKLAELRSRYCYRIQEILKGWKDLL